MNRSSRRNFFKKMTLGSLGIAFLSKTPFKLFAAEKNTKKLKKVVIHPNSVKRAK